MKVSKKLCSIFLSVFMLVSMLAPMSAVTVSAASAPALSVENVTAESGTEVSIAVKLTNSSGVYNGNFTLQYDSSKLEAVSYTYGNIFNEHTRNCNLNYQSTGNQIRFTFSGAYALTGDGTLITFTFNVKDDASGNAELNFTAYKMYDENGISLSPTATNGHISIAEKVIENPSLSVIGGTVNAGEIISVPVKISNTDSVYNGNFTLQYDSSLLTAESYTYGSIFDEHTKNCNLNYQSTGDQIRFTFSGAYPLTGDGTLVTFTFKANENVSGNAALNFTAYKMYDENGISLSPTAENGIIEVNKNGSNIITGQCGDNAYYIFNIETGTLTLNGYGEMNDFSSLGDGKYSRPWDSYTNDIMNIIISDGITSIGQYAFTECINIREVIFPESIKSINGYAFMNCSNLNYVEFDNKEIDIHQYSFFESGVYNNCYVDEKYNEYIARYLNGDILYECCLFEQGQYKVLDGTKIIAVDAFASNSSNLVSIVIPESVEYINSNAFQYCEQITIYGKSGSYAEYYANENGIPFIALDSVELSSISIYNKPTKQTYYAGDYLDTKGLQLKLTYSDGSSEIVSSGYTTNLDGVSLGAGSKNVIVTYQNLTTTFSINVQNISGTVTPSSLNLKVGDTYTLTSSIQAPEDAVLTWVTSDSTVATVSNGIVKAIGSGTAKVYIRINNNGFATTSQTCTVTVTDESEPIVLSSISISNMPTKTVYEIGELLNTTGLKLKLTYSDGSTETITSGYTVSGFDSSTAGTKTVTVKYGDLSTKFTVTVNVAEVDGPRVSVESKKASAGSTVLITVCLEENPGIWGMDLVVNYDKTQLTLTNVINGTVFSDSEWTPGNLSGNKYILSYEASGFDDITANGILATLEFTVNENATVDSFSSISLSYNVGDVINVNFDDINLAVVSGGINITDFIYGDLNGDGLVNKKDSLLMKMYLADNTTVIDMQAADVYADGSINKKDSLYLKQYLAGLDVELGV